jgi:Ca2+-binding RTX toxin-like protein
MRIEGSKGDDELIGTSRNDDIFGKAGWDLIAGRKGRDLLDGGAGNDLIKGNAGSDSIWGGKGKDFLVGGGGADFFWFDTDDSFDKINDFESGKDALVVDVSGGSDFDDFDRGDLDIDHGRKFDRIYLDDDLIAKVFGDFVERDDVLFL